VLTFYLAGEFNKLTAEEFDKEFATQGAKDVRLDFSGIAYLSSAGLRSILQAAKTVEMEGGEFAVLYPQEAVLEVFEMTHFDRFIHIVKEGEEVQEVSREYYPLRPIQRWLTDTHFHRARSTMMNNGGLGRLDPKVDLERLAEAVNGVLNAHDIFRCRLVFHPDTGELCQRFDGEVERVVVESLSEEAFEARKQELKQPYGLIDRPLYRIHIIKTSTGKEKVSATPEAAYVMCQAIREYYDETGIQIGFKPAGGINSPMDALIYYTIVKETLGDKWLTNKWFRLGTSRLANMLLSEIEGQEVKFF
jgi:anti-anti-sigma factor